jgi:hypothetical protein
LIEALDSQFYDRQHKRKQLEAASQAASHAGETRKGKEITNSSITLRQRPPKKIVFEKKRDLKGDSKSKSKVATQQATKSRSAAVAPPIRHPEMFVKVESDDED